MTSTEAGPPPGTPGNGRTPSIELVHTLGRDVVVSHAGVELFRYVYVPETAARESPKPYLHPVRTLAGNVMTIFRPHDHVWHKGIWMSWAQLSGQNFWGGPTYVRDRGYVQLPNNGRIEHRAWETMAAAGGGVLLAERLDWISADGERLLDERRVLRVAEVLPEEGCWTLEFVSGLGNVSGRPLTFGSPTTEGRPLAGYGSLTWRGPRSFTGGAVLAPGGAPGGLSGAEVMGTSAPWVAFVGRHDESGDSSTLLFVDHPGNQRYPNKWFVRTTPFACVGFAFAFDEEWVLPAGNTLPLRYGIVVADGAWDAERAARWANRLAARPAAHSGPFVASTGSKTQRQALRAPLPRQGGAFRDAVPCKMTSNLTSILGGCGRVDRWCP